MVEISFHSPHPRPLRGRRPLPKGARELLFPSRCLEAALGKTAEARDLLSPVYNSFTEGFDTKNLQEAKVLLNELT